MTVHRVTGAGVPELARRIERSGAARAARSKPCSRGSWTLRSRMLGAKSEVVQWRNGPEAPELLWSSLDATGPLQPTPDAGLALPAGCVWGTQRIRQQRTASLPAAQCALHAFGT